MTGPTENTHRVLIRRRIPAPREAVYEAWIDPEGIRQWMCPGDVHSAEASLDVRVGGAFRIVMKRNGGDILHTGVYQVVEPPAKLVFTWTQPDHEIPTLVTVELIAHGHETELVLMHERFPNADMMQRYQRGWGQITEKFAGYLARMKDN